MLLADGTELQDGQTVWFYNHWYMYSLPLIASFVPLGTEMVSNNICLYITPNQGIFIDNCYGSREAVLEIAKANAIQLVKVKQAELDEAIKALEALNE